MLGRTAENTVESMKELLKKHVQADTLLGGSTKKPERIPADITRGN
jgi:hypothetical protein